MSGVCLRGLFLPHVSFCCNLFIYHIADVLRRPLFFVIPALQFLLYNSILKLFKNFSNSSLFSCQNMAHDLVVGANPLQH